MHNLYVPSQRYRPSLCIIYIYVCTIAKVLAPFVHNLYVPSQRYWFSLCIIIFTIAEVLAKIVYKLYVPSWRYWPSLCINRMYHGRGTGPACVVIICTMVEVLAQFVY